MEIKWHGTASIEMKNQTGRILFDPFVPLKGSAVPVKIEDYAEIPCQREPALYYHGELPLQRKGGNCLL